MKAILKAAALLLCPTISGAATINVSTTSDVLADTGACSLREAVIAANTNAPSGATPGECPSGSSGSTDTIVLPAGTFNLSLAGSEDGYEVNPMVGDLDITQSVNLQGQGPTASIVSAVSLGARVLHIDAMSAVVSITGLRLRDGFVSDGLGGGVYLQNGASLALSSVAIAGNHAQYSGGGVAIEAYDADVTMNGVAVTNNIAGDAGGGIYFQSSGLLAIIDSTVTGNQASGFFATGGGVHAGAGVVVLTNSSVATNVAEYYGGGLAIDGSLTASNSTISGNETEMSGGGIYFGLLYDASEIRNSTISGNGAADYGGGVVESYGAGLTLTHVTLALNTAGLGGAAIESDGGTVVSNTLISGTCSNGPVSTLGGNIESPGDNCGLTHATDQVAVTAVQLALGALANNGGTTSTHRPASTSVAVDQARATYCLATDQRGTVRPQGPACDIGAVEVVPPFFADGFESGNTSAWSTVVP